jgi:hypothetical protein
MTIIAFIVALQRLTRMGKLLLYSSGLSHSIILLQFTSKLTPLTQLQVGCPFWHRKLDTSKNVITQASRCVAPSESADAHRQLCRRVALQQ